MGAENQRVTLEDLAGMIQRSVAHKDDIDRLENLILRIPDRVVEKLEEHQGVLQRLERIERQLGITSS